MNIPSAKRHNYTGTSIPLISEVKRQQMYMYSVRPRNNYAYVTIDLIHLDCLFIYRLCRSKSKHVCAQVYRNSVEQFSSMIGAK